MFIIDKINHQQKSCISFCVFFILILRNEICMGASIADVDDKGMALNIDHLVNISRNYDGDLLTTQDTAPCEQDICIIFGGTAEVFEETDAYKSFSTKTCKCKCLKHLSTYREDLGICVDSIRECSLIPFVSGLTEEKIPFVFLPLRGQIIFPSKELLFTGLEHTLCAVSSAEYLTTSGWVELRNPVDSSVPFQLFRDEGRTFLQWLGETILRTFLHGRLIVVHLICRDSLKYSDSLNVGFLNDIVVSPVVFTPCVSFRVVGTPMKSISNVTEVLFSAEVPIDEVGSTLTTKEYIVIAICSLCLGLIYIASVFLYIHVKKNKQNLPQEGGDNTLKDYNGGSHEVTFGAGISATSNVNSSIMDPSRFNTNLRGSNYRISGGPSGQVDEMNAVKKNPLLKHFSNLNENLGFMADTKSTVDFDDDNMIDTKMNNYQSDYNSILDHNNMIRDMISISNQESERLPEENVSITEEINEEKSDSVRAMVNGNVRRKLYFNPAYFEPDLLLSPPPSAVEFLNKIREVISIAKQKMSTKRYQPSLIVIQEEITTGSEIYASGLAASRRSSVISSRRDSSKKSNCSGCPGCEEAPCSNEVSVPSSNCRNCGDKQSSIQKWLENVSSVNNNDISSDQVISEKSGTLGRKIHIPRSIAEESNHIQSTICHLPGENIINSSQISNNRGSYGLDETISPRIVSFLKSANDNYNSFLKFRTFDDNNKKVEPYDKISKSEIYNNPQFDLNLPNPDALKAYSRVQKNHQEVLDQYSSSYHKKNLQQMPDMVYEALAMEQNYSMKSFAQFLALPTPDYSGENDSEYELIKFKTAPNDVKFVPFDPTPTPDYHTYGKNSLRSNKHYQPDSPIYCRKSPAYLVVDYETDSLERTASRKNRAISSTPSTGSDFSSQPSPSLSTALPLEEEVEIRNALYDKIEGFRKDTDTIKKEREIAINNKKLELIQTKIKYDTPNLGSMTIELEHSPDECEDISTDSDQFDPDTLDRKTKKNNNKFISKYNSEININQYRELDKKSPKYASTDNVTSLPNLSDLKQSALLQISNSDFHYASGSETTIINCDDLKAQDDFEIEKGRLLTLELRHSKRQRTVGYASLDKKSVPPDVIMCNNSCNIIRATEDFITTNKELFGINSNDKYNHDKKEIMKNCISDCTLTEIYSKNYGYAKNKTVRGNFLNLLEKSTELEDHIVRSVDDFTSLKPNKNITSETDLFKKESIKHLPDTNIYHMQLKTDSLDGTRGKKSKDLKNAWKRFVGIATSKFRYNKQSENVDEVYYDAISVFNEGVSSLIGNNHKVEDIENPMTHELKNVKVRNIVKQLNIINHVAGVKVTSPREQDSGYISAESNESKNKLYERFNFAKNDKNHNESTNMRIIQEVPSTVPSLSRVKITENSRIVTQIVPPTIGKSLRQFTKRPTIAPPPLPVGLSKSTNSSLNRRPKEGLNNNSLNGLGAIPIDNHDLINVNIYSSDDERDSSFNSDSDDLDCDSISVTSSIETHSVLYKNTRKN